MSGSDALVMFTYGGDANLDGKINVDDYGIIDFNIGIQGPPFFTTAAATAPGQSFTAVPEPASLSLFWAAAACLASGARRRRA